MIINNKSKMICPSCNKEQDEAAIDYTFEYRGTGESSRCIEKCDFCDKKYSAFRINENEVKVDKY